MSAWWLDRNGKPPVAGAARTDAPVLVGDKTHARRALERRRRAFTPEWTREDRDDAGVALRGLLLELSTPLSTRINRLPEKATIEFLNLAGLAPLGARPATAFVVFEALESLGESIPIPAGFQLSAPPAAGGSDPVFFETIDPLFVVPLTIASLATEIGNGASAFKPSADPAAAFRPFGLRPQAGAALLIGLQGTARVRESLTLLFETVGVDADPPPVGVGGTQGRPSIAPPQLEWSVLDAGSYVRIEPNRDETAALTTTGLVELRAPARWRPGNPRGITEAEALRWLRVRLLDGDYVTPPRLASIHLNAARVEAGRTINGEALTPVPGRERREFSLSQTPILPGSVRLEIDESPAEQGASDAGAEPWHEVPDLAEARPEERAFSVDGRRGIVYFGDDVHGRSVPEGFRNVRALSYRVGGGVAGRAAVDTISTLISTLPGVIAARNPLAASGGSDVEATQEALRRGPEEIRARGRAVACADYALYARQAPGADAARAHAVTAYHAQFPGARIPGVVTVFVVARARQDGARPVADSETLRNVANFLTAKVAPAGVEVVAAVPPFHAVSVRVDLQLETGADPTQTVRAVAQALDDYLHPLRGGDDRLGWPFGGPIRYDGLVRTVMAVNADGRGAVRSVRSLDYTVDGRSVTDCSDCEILPHSLLWPSNHRVSIARNVT